MSTSLESVLSGRDSQPEPQAAPEPTPAPEPVAAETAPEPASEPEAVEPDQSKSSSVPVDALHAERQKRKELERQLAQLEGRGKAYEDLLTRQQNPQAEPEPEDDKDAYYDDPAAWTEKRIQEALARKEQEFLQRDLYRSEMRTRQNHEDAQEAFDAFAEYVKANPAAYQQMLQDVDPGEFAYKTGKLYQETKDAGSITDLRAKIEKDLRVKLEAEIKQKLAQEAAGAVTPSNATARGSGTTTAPAYTGPTPLGQILAR